MALRQHINILLMTLCLAASHARAGEQFEALYRSALIHFNAERYTEAESLFSQTTGYKARMGQAVSAYRLDQVDKAMSLFMQSVLLADDDEQRYRALYNAASCRFLSGDYSSALTLYTDAIKYKPDDTLAAQFIELSAYLDRLVLADIARKNAKSDKKKSSEGKKTVSAIEFVFDEDINLRLEDNESTENITINTQQAFKSDRQLLKNLIQRGIDAIELDTSSPSHALSYVDLNIINEFSSLQQLPYTSPASVSQLWKRLFELEQGYPASLQQVEILPGLRPW